MRFLIPFLLIFLILTGCSHRIAPQKEVAAPGSLSQIPDSQWSDGYSKKGIASWYGPGFHGRSTANGETYDMYSYTAAHKLLPFQTLVRVTNLENGKKVNVRINDRGPFVKDRIIDLSYAAAKSLDMIRDGTAPVIIRTLSPMKAQTDTRYFIQVGSFLHYSNAREMLVKVRNNGFRGSRINKAHVHGQTYWRVQAGAFSDLQRARRELKLMSRTIPSSFIVAD